MSSRSHKILKLSSKNTANAAQIEEFLDHAKAANAGPSHRMANDRASMCSSISPSEMGMLNPLYVEQVHGTVKCENWLKEKSLQNISTPPKTNKMYGIVSYTPSSTNTTMTHRSVDQTNFKVPDEKQENVSLPIQLTSENKALKSSQNVPSPMNSSERGKGNLRIGLTRVRRRIDTTNTDLEPSQTEQSENEKSRSGTNDNKENSLRQPTVPVTPPTISPDKTKKKTGPKPNNCFVARQRQEKLQKKQSKDDAVQIIKGVLKEISKGTAKSESDGNLRCEDYADDSTTSKLSPYQLIRLKNLRENENFLQDLEASLSPDINIDKRTNEDTAKNSTEKSAKPSYKKSHPLPEKEKRTTARKEQPSRVCRSVARKLINDMSDSSSVSVVSSENDILAISDTSGESSQESDYESDGNQCGRKTQLEKDDTTEERHFLSEEEEGGQNESLQESSQLNQSLTKSPCKRNHSGTMSEEEDADDPSDNQDGYDEVAPHVKFTKRAKLAQQKSLRNMGKRHTTRKGKVVQPRKRKPPHECKIKKCHEVITPEVGDELFKEYWSQASHNKRVAYAAGRIEREIIKRKRSRKHIEEREKNQTFKYFLDINGARHQVCRSTFLNTLGETDRFLRGVTENKSRSLSGIPSDDRRGKKTPPHALSTTNKAEAVDRHIQSFPAYISHYCRAKTGETKYLSSDLSVAEMYRQYIDDESNPKVSLSTYTNLFKATGLKFHHPQTDGCDRCDTLDIAISNAPAASEEKKNLEETKELHLRKAEKAYGLKRAAKLHAKSDPTKKVLVCDMQQCLPTPHLKCKRIYYSRQLYVLNYTVNDTSTDLTYHYMWTEVEGRRGSNEVASCLLRHILENIAEGVEELTIFSDCCSGQNRNNTMCMMFFVALQEHPSLKKIEHILLVPGHTFMAEVDTKHAIIEKHKKYVDKINIPEEWYSIVDKAGKGKFVVHHMEEFRDIAALSKNEFVKRMVCNDKAPFKYMKTHWWKYEKSSIGLVSVKSNFNELAPFRTLSFLRKGVRSDRVQKLFESIQVLPGSVPISDKKKTDLIKLLPYLSEEFHKYYQDLPASANVVDFHPDVRSVSEKDCNNEQCNVSSAHKKSK